MKVAVAVVAAFGFSAVAFALAWGVGQSHPDGAGNPVKVGPMYNGVQTTISSSGMSGTYRTAPPSLPVSIPSEGSVICGALNPITGKWDRLRNPAVVNEMLAAKQIVERWIGMDE